MMAHADHVPGAPTRRARRPCDVKELVEELADLRLGVVYLCGMLPFFVLDRYRYPIVPILAILGGAAVGNAQRWWSTSPASVTATAIGSVGLNVVACTWGSQ